MNIAISGVRDLSPYDLPVIEGVISDIIFERPEELFFGGARGTDTVALASACATLEGLRPPKLTVIVPRRLKDQPLEAQEWARECADEIIEIKSARLDTEAYRRRNQALIRRADGLVAFWDGRSGGTGMTIDLARKAGVPVEIIEVLGLSIEMGTNSGRNRPITTYIQPWPHCVYAPTSTVAMPVVSLGLYMPAIEGLDRLTQFVRATKAGTVGPIETKYWAGVVSNVISARPELMDAVAIIPVPRRLPYRKNDMTDLVARIAVETGKINGTDLLIRTEEPVGGEFKGGRDRFDASEHARTIAMDLERDSYNRISPGSKVILMDNVLTFGGTLEGARQALIRDLPGIEPIGFSVLVSGDYAVT
jgi:hypothetical protein